MDKETKATKRTINGTQVTEQKSGEKDLNLVPMPHEPIKSVKEKNIIKTYNLGVDACKIVFLPSEMKPPDENHVIQETHPGVTSSREPSKMVLSGTLCGLGAFLVHGSSQPPPVLSLETRNTHQSFQTDCPVATTAVS